MQSHALYHCISCDSCDEETEAQGEEGGFPTGPLLRLQHSWSLKFVLFLEKKKKTTLYADHYFKFFIEFVTILLWFYVLVFWQRGMWDLSSLDRD